MFGDVNITWIISLTIMVIFGICIAITFSSLAGFAGMLPSKYMSAFMLGMSFNGFGVLVLRIITLLSFDIWN